MGFIVKKYVESFMIRYDPDKGIPFPEYSDFPGLVCEPGSFKNSDGSEVRYFTYYYDGYRGDKLILFLHGLGPGHVPYTVDIERYCRAGYKVLALDYTGCGASGGDSLPSVNAPARDAVELIELLDPKEEVIPVGHSLGGYTALTVANCLSRVKRAVIISGFVSVADEMVGVVKLRILTHGVTRFEKKRIPRFGSLNNRKYLKSTDDKILWIHSKDDPVVDFKHNAGQAIRLGNPNVHVVAIENKQHMPQYTREALGRMNEWFGEYNREVNGKKLVSVEEKRAFFSDKPVMQMMEPDPAVFEVILDFIK